MVIFRRLLYLRKHVSGRCNCHLSSVFEPNLYSNPCCGGGGQIRHQLK